MEQIRKGIWLPVLMSLLVGCSTVSSGKPPGSGSEPASFAPPSQLAATLTNGNVFLHWKNNCTADGGNWVEFATPGSQYVQLNLSSSDAKATSFLHPKVAPQTTCLYRIQPYFGQASKPVEITTGVPTNNTPGLEEGPIVPTGTSTSGKIERAYSIRSLRTFATAAPADLTAALSSPTSVDLHWKDRASDEDGYLLEIGRSSAGPFNICALLPPDTTSFRKIQLPPKMKCCFRVRAYFYGKPSGIASVYTSDR